MKRKLITILMVLLVLVMAAEPIFAWNYTIKPGDSLWSVARKTGVTVNRIKNASGIWSDRVKPGQRIAIPSNNSLDINLLARLVEAEAGGEPYKGKVGVASVILNRIDDSRFPDTLKGVVYQRHAFESVSNGLIWRVHPSSESYKAARAAINGWDPSYNSLFFWNPYKPVSSWIWSRSIVVQYGDHVFAR